MGGIDEFLKFIKTKLEVQKFSCTKLDERIRNIEGYRIGNIGFITIGSGTMSSPLQETSTPILRLPFKKVLTSYQLVYSSGCFANLEAGGTLRVRTHMLKPVTELAFTMSFIILEE